MKILVTSALAPAGLSVARLLRNRPNRPDVEVETIDASTGEIPHGTSPTYPAAIFNYMYERGINFIIPCSDDEVISLVEAHVPGTIASPLKLVRLCSDKAELYEYLDGCGIPVPRYVVGGFVKRRDGRGNDENLRVSDDYLLCEYLPGDEITIDALYVSGKRIASIGRRRDEVVRGIAVTGTIIDPDQIEPHLRHVEQAMPDFDGPVGIQLKADARGGFRVIDINLRFGGGLTIDYAAGIDLVGYLLSYLNPVGIPIEQSYPRPVLGVHRSWLQYEAGKGWSVRC